jgi:hypothetical protein
MLWSLIVNRESYHTFTRYMMLKNLHYERMLCNIGIILRAEAMLVVSGHE